ncbi:hypothetical protein V8E36_008357 [Tilletia maclaganii]
MRRLRSRSLPPEPGTRAKQPATTSGPSHAPGPDTIPEGEPLAWDRNDVDQVQIVEAPDLDISEPLPEDVEEDREGDMEPIGIVEPPAPPAIPAPSRDIVKPTSMKDLFDLGLPAWEPEEDEEGEDEEIEPLTLPPTLHLPTNLDVDLEQDQTIPKQVDLFRQTPDLPAQPRRSRRLPKQKWFRAMMTKVGEVIQEASLMLHVC